MYTKSFGILMLGTISCCALPKRSLSFYDTILSVFLYIYFCVIYIRWVNDREGWNLLSLIIVKIHISAQKCIRILYKPLFWVFQFQVSSVYFLLSGCVSNHEFMWNWQWDTRVPRLDNDCMLKGFSHNLIHMLPFKHKLFCVSVYLENNLLIDAKRFIFSPAFGLIWLPFCLCVSTVSKERKELEGSKFAHVLFIILRRAD
jgi:hypothetical protein